MFRLICIVLLCTVFGCAKATTTSATKDIVKDCVLPPEQTNSLQGHWASLPIKISFHSGDFSGDQVVAVQNAVKTWNDFFSASKGKTVIDGGPDGSGNQSSLVQTVPNCNSGTVSDGAVLYKRTSTWTKSATAVAVTTFCFNNSTNGSLRTIFNAIMEFNFENFFGSNTGRFPDMQSIALHESGHLLGLDHSCGALQNGQPNVGCPDPNSDSSNPLLSTVMFPSVFFDASGNGEVKRDLQENDQGRANCLY